MGSKEKVHRGGEGNGQTGSISRDNMGCPRSMARLDHIPDPFETTYVSRLSNP